MDFKLKRPVALRENDDLLLAHLRVQCANNESVITHIANKITDRDYHELCHQSYLHGLASEIGEGTFLTDDGEIDDKTLGLDPDKNPEIMRERKHTLVAKLLRSKLGWSIYCNTMGTLYR